MSYAVKYDIVIRDDKNRRDLSEDKITYKEDKMGFLDFVNDIDDDDEEMIITLTMEDDSELDCCITAVFEVDDQKYMALTPVMDDEDEEEEEEEAYIFRYSEEKDGSPVFEHIEDDNEFKKVAKDYEKIINGNLKGAVDEAEMSLDKKFGVKGLDDQLDNL